MPAPTITPLPTPPSRSQSPETFSTDADAFLGALPDFATEANDQADYLDTLAAAVDADATAASNAAAVAIGAANYQGDYSAGTTYQIGESVSYNSYRWVAKTVNTGVTPVDGANWFRINDGDVLGPASATNNALVVFDGTTGKLVKNGVGNGSTGSLLTSSGAGVVPNWLAPGAAGALLASGGAGSQPAYLAQGTTGQVLTSAGAGASPTWTTLSTGVQFQQSIQTSNYTLVLGDAGKQIFHPNTDGAIRTFTIPANSSVAFPIGTVVLFTADVGSSPIRVTINSDLLISGEGYTGTITVPPNNTLMAIKVSATKWMANLLYQNDQGGQTLIYTTTSSPYLFAVRLTDTGLGQTYAIGSGFVNTGPFNLDIHPAGDAVGLALFNGSPMFRVYGWSKNGFGTAFINPSPGVTGSYCRSVKFSPNGDAILFGSEGAPNIHAWRWQSGSGFGSKYSDPATAVGSEVLGIAFHPANNAVAMINGTSPFIHVYAWTSASGFGTKYANPASTPASIGEGGIRFSPAGDAIAVAGQTTPFIQAYAWNSTTGFGTKFANPGTLPPSTGYDVDFHPNGDAIAICHASSPYISVYAWSAGGFGTKYADPATTPTDIGRSVKFSPLGNWLAVGDNNAGSPPFRLYPWNSATGFGTIINTGFGNSATYKGLSFCLDR